MNMTDMLTAAPSLYQSSSPFELVGYFLMAAGIYTGLWFVIKYGLSLPENRPGGKVITLSDFLLREL